VLANQPDVRFEVFVAVKIHISLLGCDAG